jgi:hypothetical protein
MAPRSRRGMDIRHMTLAQYRYFRDVGLAGQLPDSQNNLAFRGRAPLRNRRVGGVAVLPWPRRTVRLVRRRAGRGGCGRFR